MNLDSARLRRTGEVFSCILENPGITVEVRSGEGINRLSDLDGIESMGEIHVMVLSPIRDVAKQLGGQLAHAKNGDAVIIYAPTTRIRHTAIDTLTKKIALGQQCCDDSS
ncbi:MULTISPECIES: hypothetical protein [unclassified Paraburkholderia]|uniref:hypothetical protein n=1 Tax=unclassified Paraburkholderia TaxID=2615204 RepID=UPI002AB186DC|nr:MULTISPECIES: hypothetical protein [unclassified Paraburkholderia]